LELIKQTMQNLPILNDNIINKNSQSKQEKSRRSRLITTKIYENSLFTLQNTIVQKQKINAYDQLFRYYNVKIPIPISLHKIFILIEMQVNAAITRAKLMPYIFIVHDLCKLGIVHVNGKIIANQFHLLQLWDVLSIPIPLYNRVNYRLQRKQNYPRLIAKVFKRYWKHIANFNQNRLWILSNSLTNMITAESTIFDYPNLLLYTGIFRRFTRLHYEVRPYPANKKFRYLSETNSLLKLKTLSYLGFYHR